MSLEDKINELESRINSPTKEELSHIDMLREEVSRMGRYESFLKHPITKEIVDKIIGWIRDANLLLLDGRSIINEEREKAIIQRDILIKILDIFSPKKINKLELEKHIDSKIKEVVDFFGRQK